MTISDTAPPPRTAESGPRILTIATVQADLDGRRLWVNGVHIPLPRSQFDVLAALMENAGRVVPPGELHDLIGTRDRAPSSAAIRTYIRRLRYSLAAHPAVLTRLRTIHGFGYAFDLDPRPPA